MAGQKVWTGYLYSHYWISMARTRSAQKTMSGCRVVGVARTAYYAHKFHVPSDRDIRRLLLTDHVADVHARSRGTYGMLRIRAALKIVHDMM